MNFGQGIKTLRKHKGVKQKELAAKCNISANALCQIENGNAFPQRETLNKVCAALQFPTSYLLFFSITEDDIPEEKRKMFKQINGMIKSLLLDG